MALGTVTTIKKGVFGPGGLRYVILNVQPTTGANYTANGEAVALSKFEGFRKEVIWAVCTPKEEGDNTQFYAYDTEADKLVAFDWAGAEVAGSTDLSTKEIRIFAVGR